MSVLARDAAQEFGSRLRGMAKVSPARSRLVCLHHSSGCANPITMAPQFNSSASLCPIDVDEIALRERKEI